MPETPGQLQPCCSKQEKSPGGGFLLYMLAERVGFEPTIRYARMPDFESGAFDHSATSPEIRSKWSAIIAGRSAFGASDKKLNG